MRCTRLLPWLCPLLSMPIYGGEPVGEMPQQMQLNRASQQELRNIQTAPEAANPAPPASRPWWQPGPESRDRQQQSEQRTMQEGQRREVLLQNQRAKAVNEPSSTRRLDAIGRQRQFRHQQQNQLNRFRIQQGGKGR